FITPPLTATTTYLVSSEMSFPVLLSGPTANTIGTGGSMSGASARGIKFNATADQTLVSVDVYANTSA
ncbi:hypothetical protein, partial [Shewanella algae]|uniref:hypothetical protein n=1 Tax=Shewanella algae TaxID=38313 RepID=UPI00313DF8A4